MAAILPAKQHTVPEHSNNYNNFSYRSKKILIEWTMGEMSYIEKIWHTIALSTINVMTICVL